MESFLSRGTTVSSKDPMVPVLLISLSALRNYIFLPVMTYRYPVLKESGSTACLVPGILHCLEYHSEAMRIVV